ncbi:trypsin-1-like [Plutella xylostella]|uniref:trypsin-1-like n=1 Tax=Plutella xylostella TaxID=51655 RepID=UPI002032F426|nr:trypsin-1-like [Plutella xylostella]
MVYLILIVFTCFTFINSAPQLEDRWSWGFIEDDVNTTKAPEFPIQEDDKSWGYLDETEVTTRLRDLDEDKKCAPFNPKVPDFKAAHRRIIQTKCYEYIWLIKYREKAKKKNEACFSEPELRPEGSNIDSGARYVYQGEYPHMAAIGWRRVNGSLDFRCGGSLISSKFVLTAAQCTAVRIDTTLPDREPHSVRLGHTTALDTKAMPENSLDIKIHRIIRSPKFIAGKKYNDIALLELEADVKFSKFIQPACLYHIPDVLKLSKKARATGWGIFSEAALETPKLKVAHLNIVDDATCNAQLGRLCGRAWCRVRDQVCSGDPTGAVDTCWGDSGGPLQVEIPLPTTEGKIHYVIGITSFGVGCGQPDTPGVYTKVSSYLDWIESVVWPQG